MTGGRIALSVTLVVATTLAALSRQDAIVREGRDSKPRPDALEYGVGARSLVERGRLELEIGGAHYPLRYPPGFPVLAAPYVAAAGGKASAAWRASFVHGVAAVPVITLVGHLVGGPVGALFAAVVALGSPLVTANSGLAMSETTSELLWALALAGAFFAVWRREGAARLAPLWIAGVALGLGVTVRYTNLALLVPALLFFATRHRFRPARPGRAILAVLVPALAGVAVLLVYQWRTFGAPLADGYAFWVPEVYTHSDLVFSPRYIAAGIPGYWPNGHLETYGRELLGLDAGLWRSPWIAALALVGVVRAAVLARTCAVNRILLLASGVALPAVFVFHLLYFWQDPRFLVPLLPLLAALAAGGAAALVAMGARAFGPAGRGRGVLTAVAIAGGLALIAFEMPRAWFDRFRRDVADGPRRVAPLPPALTDQLPGLDRDLPRSSLVIVNFPVTLAEPALGHDREIIVSDADSADPHLNAIELHDLRGRDGMKPSTRFLAHGKTAVQTHVDAVFRAVGEGRAVYYLESVGEGADGAGIGALRGACSFEEVLARPPVTVWRITPRR